LLFSNFLFHLFSLTFLFIIFSDATTGVGSFNSTGRVAGQLGAEHRRGELFKRRYGKSSENHGVTDPVPVGVTSVVNLADFAPALKNPVPRVDNPVDYAPGVKNPEPSVDNPADSAPVVKNPADSLPFLLPPMYWRVLIF